MRSPPIKDPESETYHDAQRHMDSCGYGESLLQDDGLDAAIAESQKLAEEREREDCLV